MLIKKYIYISVPTAMHFYRKYKYMYLYSIHTYLSKEHVIIFQNIEHFKVF